MCYHTPHVFPRFFSSNTLQIDIQYTLQVKIPEFITRSFNYIPIWIDREFDYHDIWEIRVAGIHRHYNDQEDILWDVILVVYLVSGRYFLIRLPMINMDIRVWDITFTEVYTNLHFYEETIPVIDVMYYRNCACNMFMSRDRHDTFIVSRRMLDDYLIVPEEPHAYITVS